MGSNTTALMLPPPARFDSSAWLCWMPWTTSPTWWNLFSAMCEQVPQIRLNGIKRRFFLECFQVQLHTELLANDGQQSEMSHGIPIRQRINTGELSVPQHGEDSAETLA